MLVAGTGLPLPLLRRGKVRDVYAVDDERILIVATDRVSAFDVVLGEPIPFKGAVLTQLTAWWLGQLGDRVAHHLITGDTEEIVAELPALAAWSKEIAGRAMLCRRTTVFPIECVIRGYISGSAWKEYAAAGTLAGEPLPSGLRESDKLPRPLFSPATKAESGHDENIPVSRMREIIGGDATRILEDMTRLVYDFGTSVALQRGIIIADTKLEFGHIGSPAKKLDPSRVILIDEVLTPDSSRFWAADGFNPGRSQPSFDKQPLRDYLDRMRTGGQWNGEAPAPPLPDEIVRATSERYLEAYRRITLEPLDTGVID
jgi:phosphoribosylaminoimidazole-succinocarboxamide synthase